MKKKTIEVKLNIPISGFTAAAARIGYSLLRQATNEEILLSYFIKYSKDGIYHAAKNTRYNCLQKTGLTRNQYQAGIKKLLSDKAIIQRENANGSRFVYFEFHKLIKNLIKKHV